MWVYAAGAIVSAWLFVLSYIIYKTRKHYFHLTKRTRKENIDEILDKLIDDDRLLATELEKARKEVTSLIQESKKSLKKTGLVRFNAFGRTRSDQSFVIALLSEEQNGIVINFIYTPEGVRVYTKEVRAGKGADYPLSQEEKDAVEKSLKA